MTTLSGGELQRVAITLALGKPADIYLIDEPSAYLDSEQRLIAAKVWCRCLTCISAHVGCRCSSASSCTPRRRPLSSSTTLSWLPTWLTVSSSMRVRLQSRTFIPPTLMHRRHALHQGPRQHPTVPADGFVSVLVHCMTWLIRGFAGMNKFLGMLEITFRRDPTNFRPRINKVCIAPLVSASRSCSCYSSNRFSTTSRRSQETSSFWMLMINVLVTSFACMLHD